jgi:hypothetical protein
MHDCRSHRSERPSLGSPGPYLDRSKATVRKRLRWATLEPLNESACATQRLAESRCGWGIGPTRNTSMYSQPLNRTFDKIATVTLAHYQRHAEEYRAGTRDHDVSQNIASLLRHIEGESPFQDSRFWLRAGARPQDFGGPRPHCRRAGGCGCLRCHGACRQRGRSVAAGFPQA